MQQCIFSPVGCCLPTQDALIPAFRYFRLRTEHLKFSLRPIAFVCISDQVRDAARLALRAPALIYQGTTQQTLVRVRRTQQYTLRVSVQVSCFSVSESSFLLASAEPFLVGSLLVSSKFGHVPKVSPSVC